MLSQNAIGILTNFNFMKNGVENGGFSLSSPCFLEGRGQAGQSEPVGTVFTFGKFVKIPIEYPLPLSYD